MKNNLTRSGGVRLVKIVLGGVLLAGVTVSGVSHAQGKTLPVAEKVELDKYLGLWYEVVRKPTYFQNKCVRDVSVRYTVNENGNIAIDNRCHGHNGELIRSLGEAFVSNEPFNSKFRVSFLPEVVRWLPVGRSDYWILKLEDDYQMVLIGEPKRKYLWILARDPHPDETLVNEYLKYAQSAGYDVKDVMHTQQLTQ
ncbi:lipocalin family protein [Acinetobacter sp. WZC-1]|uniref:lipocalin family protein n=1 Tax=Acinetobacter sp. WZC-1 TaxID=3459034 RepID=UPI00403D58A9